MEGSTVKKEARIDVETSEKNWGYVAGVGEFENGGNSPWGPGKEPQKIFENLFFEKSIGKCVCCEASVVPPCRLV